MQTIAVMKQSSALFMSQCRTKIVERGAIRIDDDDDDDENNQGHVKLFTCRYQEG